MTRNIWWLVVILVVAGGAWLYLQNQDEALVPGDVVVNQPVANSVITSPLAISGQAVGTWYFEASFPIKLLDSNNQVIAQTTATALSDWMTTNPVPFSANLTFPAQPAGSQGTLVFAKDNPSGDPQNDDAYSITVNF